MVWLKQKNIFGRKIRCLYFKRVQSNLTIFHAILGWNVVKKWNNAMQIFVNLSLLQCQFLFLFTHPKWKDREFYALSDGIKFLTIWIWDHPAKLKKSEKKHKIRFSIVYEWGAAKWCYPILTGVPKFYFNFYFVQFYEMLPS